MTKHNEILEAHVQFELQRYRADRLQGTLHEEITALFGWLAQCKVQDILEPSQLQDWVRYWAVEAPIPDEVMHFIKENVTVAYELLLEDHTTVAAIVPRPLFDENVAAVIRLDGLRRLVTHQVVTSSVYTRLISDILYHGIKDFLLVENTFAKNIPGASSFMRLGQNALSAAAPGLEKNIDAQLIAFINANIQDTIRESERFLDEALDEATMRGIGEEIWQSIAAMEIAELAGHVDKAVLPALVENTQRFWLHFRRTQLFADLIAAVVRSFFLRYGKRDLAWLLREAGITPEVAEQEAHKLALPFLQHAHAAGFLEERIRQRLDAFYTAYFAAE